MRLLLQDYQGFAARPRVLEGVCRGVMASRCRRCYCWTVSPPDPSSLLFYSLPSSATPTLVPGGPMSWLNPSRGKPADETGEVWEKAVLRLQQFFFNTYKPLVFEKGKK